ncbi:MAG: MFS transporter [Alphaproteobacteria bacterium]|nr:MFS transporter [Alphaproteobacteria bacterium]
MAVSALRRYRTLLIEQPAFRRFWIGFAAAVTADEIVRIAIVWFVYAHTGSPAAVGWLMVAFTAPILIGGFFAGWVLDRFDRRLAMALDNLLRAIAILSVPILHALDLLALWHLYLVAAVFGLLMMIPLAGTPTLIPALVPAERRQAANGLEVLGYTVGGVVGPLLGGALIAGWGAPLAVLLSAAIYLAFAWALARLPQQQAAGARPRQAPLGAAVRLLAGNRFLLSTTLMFLVFNIGLGLVLAWLPVLAETRLSGGAEAYGLLLAAFAAGQMVAALLAGGAAPGGRLGLCICIAQALAGAAIAALLPAHDVLAAAAALFAFGAMAAPLTVWAQTLRMAIVPPPLHGRTFALLRTMMQGGRPIGGATAALVVEPSALGVAILLSAFLVGVPGVLGLAVRDLRGAQPPS